MSKRKSSRKPFHQAMSNLIKTVKADAPTLLLGKRPSAAGDAKASKPVAPAPRRTPRTPRSPLLKGKPAMKSAKARAAAARRPMIAAVMALLLACGGYYLYRHLSMPKVQVKHVATQWLDKSAGKRPSHVVHHSAVTHHTIGCHVPQHTAAVAHPVSHPAAHPVKAVAKHKAVKSHHKIASKAKHGKAKRANVATAKPKHNVQQAAYYPGN